MRGKLNAQLAPSTVIRITPAGAGKTQQQTHRPLVCWDHPRRCGENAHAAKNTPGGQGSPPQVRGKPFGCSICSSFTGITPAGAGKTAEALGGLANHGDHPRRCGENLSGRLLPGGALGSPPQVRGKLFLWTTTSLLPRITPAGAGKTAV